MPTCFDRCRQVRSGGRGAEVADDEQSQIWTHQQSCAGSFSRLAAALLSAVQCRQLLGAEPEFLHQPQRGLSSKQVGKMFHHWADLTNKQSYGASLTNTLQDSGRKASTHEYQYLWIPKRPVSLYQPHLRFPRCKLNTSSAGRVWCRPGQCCSFVSSPLKSVLADCAVPFIHRI